MVGTAALAALMVVAIQSPVPDRQPASPLLVVNVGTVVDGTVVTRPPAPSWLFNIAMGGLSSGNSADLTSTLYALKRGQKEGNPVMRQLGNHPVAFAAAKTAVTVGTMAALAHLHKKRPKLATFVAAGAAGAMWSVALHNLQLARR